jgi:hypothetical protein
MSDTELLYKYEAMARNCWRHGLFDAKCRWESKAGRLLKKMWDNCDWSLNINWRGYSGCIEVTGMYE